MEDTIEKLDQDIMVADKQLEIEKNMFAYTILHHGLGNNMKKELEKPLSKRKVFAWKIKNFFYNFFRTI